MVIEGYVKVGIKDICFVFVVFISDYIEIFYEFDIEVKEEVEKVNCLIWLMSEVILIDC